MSKFILKATSLSTFEVEVEADSLDEAQEMFDSLDYNEFKEIDSDWNYESTTAKGEQK